jgi:hypothetical protein
MELTFLLPLIAAIVLFGLVIMTIRYYITTKLMTFLFFLAFSLMFGVIMILRIITILSTEDLHLYPASNLLYINGIWLLVIFIDLIAEGKSSSKTIFASYFAGALSISQLFIDKFNTQYVEGTGWVSVPQNLIHFGGFVVFAAISIFLFMGRYLFSLYNKSKGAHRKILGQIMIVFLITGGGVGIFTVSRSFLITTNGFINNMDAICIMLGFGYLQYMYLRHPTIFHIDMVDVELYGLFVYDRNTGNLLYSYIFDQTRFGGKEIIGSVLKGIDLVFKEILASDQQLKQIEHGSNFILFSEGNDLIFGLFTNVSSILTNNWLYRFRLDFEKEFAKDIEEYKRCNSICYDNQPDRIVRKIFLNV